MTKVKRARPSRATRDRRAHCFGAHMSIAGGVHRALQAALALRCDTVQLFVKNQRQWQATPLRPDDLTRWFELLPSLSGPPVAHATYLINLASPDRRLWQRSRDAFAEELLRCQTLRIPYLVVHPGSATTSRRSAAIRRVAKALDQIFDAHPDLTVQPLLETTAGAGATLGATFAELGEIIGLLADPHRVGVCVDTSHVFAAGYDIRLPAGYDAMIAEAQHAVGLKRIRCWHLNDSAAPCGSRRDRHAHVGHGHIGTAGFRHVLQDHRFIGLPMILETPKETDARGVSWDARNLRRLRRIAAGVQHAPRHNAP
jgi:deoxyribonuclease-4